MKLSPRQIDDLLTLVEHTRTDLSYYEGGSYTEDSGETFNKKDAKKSERAIELIKKIILERE